jgi:4-hydroxy-2-oxoheptanedioate aldolase
MREVLASGRPTVGGWCLIPSALTAEVVARSGFDWVVIDTQHGLIGYETMVGMLQAVDAAGVPAMVRVSANSASEIGKALDAGAHGVIVPLVNGPEEAVAAVRACRYPPDGVRSFGPVRASWTLDEFSPDAANRTVVCLIQVETVEAVAQIESIVATTGLDGVYLGPADLALSAGAPISLVPAEMEHLDLIDRTAEACTRRGLALGTVCRDGASVLEWARRGFTLLSCATDDSFLRQSCARELATVRNSELWGSSGLDAD